MGQKNLPDQTSQAWQQRLRERESFLAEQERRLQKRECALKLQKTKTELKQHQVYPTAKHDRPETVLQHWGQWIVAVSKFVGIVVVMLVLARLATWLAGMVLLAGIIWVVYKIFFEDDLPKP